ncbi:hypothetical protein EVG20_g7720 [Dentipellis fragilis]|uniref:Uncharacterized protein n=1 Tax=Dentipellis fragilis TaxID=205917 RepID=A0A4Y9YBD6_9AGAM|nr:hypothetical protein EVG20_g7720 [Dentipellis fragilis]
MVTLTSVPSCWEVPADGESLVYLLDLRSNDDGDDDDDEDDTASVTVGSSDDASDDDDDDDLDHDEDEDTQPHPDIDMYKLDLKDRDTWGKGSGGSPHRPTAVFAFGDSEPVDCRVASHFCCGIWYCDAVDTALVAADAGDGSRQTLKDQDAATRGKRIVEASCSANHAAIDVIKVPVGKCTYVVPPRVVRKHSKCPFPHVEVDKAGHEHAVEGRLLRRACPSKITIMYPVEKADCRAIVVLSGAHTIHSHAAEGI